jgi:hypothetical protein
MKLIQSHKGIKPSEETLIKRSAALKGKKRPEYIINKLIESRMKQVTNLDTGITFKSITEASKYYGNLNISNITACCKGNRNTCGGYHWEYKTI